MKLLTIIVLYRPDIDVLLKEIDSLKNESDEILLFQNSTLKNHEVKMINDHLKEDREKIRFVGNGANIGISGALNFAMDWGANNSFSHLLTMDQDSYFEPGALKLFKYKIDLLSERVNIGIYSANPVINGKAMYKKNIEDVFPEIDTITSGSIFSIPLLKHFGGFDNSLFIDAVDYEFCYRIFSLENKQAVILPDVYLHHEFGYPTDIGFGLMSENYSAFRTYYIVRNHIVIWKRYPNLFRPEYKIRLVRTHIIIRSLKIMIGEKDKWNKLKAIAKGIIHGIVKK